MSGKKGIFVRLSPETEARLRDIAARNKASLGDVVSVAVDLLANGSSGAFAARMAEREAASLTEAKERDA